MPGLFFSRQAEKTAPWEAVAVLILPLLLVSALLRSGLPSLADAQIHLFRAVEWDYLWRNGLFLPTWAPNLAFGYGYPLFNFAPPLPYVIIDGWHWVGLSFETAAKLLSATILYLSCLGGYFFARRTLDFGPALLVAAAHIYTPFVFRQHLLYGGNYPQLLGMALFPWGLWALHRVLSEQRKSAVVWTALIVAAALLSHLFQGFLLIGLLVGYIAFFQIRYLLNNRGENTRPDRCAVRLSCLTDFSTGAPVRSFPWILRRYQIRYLLARRTLYAVGGLVLGAGLAAYFVLPVFIERAWTWSQSVYYAQKSPIALRFLSLADLSAWPARLDANAANPWVPFSLGPTILGLAGLGLLTLFWQRKRPAVVSHSIFCVLLVAASVFMMLPESEPLWQAFAFLAVAEFPWRLFGLAILGLAYLAGTGVQALLDGLAWLWSSGSRQALLVIPGLLLILTPVVPLFYPTAPFLELGNPTVADHLRYEMTGLVFGGTNLGEYTPQWVAKQPADSPLVPAILAGQTPDRLDLSSLPSSADATFLDSTPLSFRYQLTLPAAQTVRFHLFYFPGWQASIDGLYVPIFPEAESGLLLVDVPSGGHSVEVAYHLPAYRWFALAISACALLALLVLGRSGSRRPSATIQQAAALPRYVAGFLLLLLGFKLGFLDGQTQWLHTFSPPGQAIAAQTATDVVFGEKMRLLGFDLDKSVYHPGDRMHIRLYWQAQQPLDTNFTTFVHLDTLPPVETRATSDNEVPGDAQAQIDIPTSTWRSTAYVRDEHRFSLPADLPPLVYQVRIGVYDPETGERLPAAAGETDVLTTVHVIDDSRLPSPFQAQEYRIGESIQLWGYGLAGEETSEIKCSLAAVATCQPSVTLVWRADKAVADDLTVLLHLIGPDGALYGQGDGPPVEGRYPTSLWLPGQMITDTHTIQIGSALPAGSYRILTGFYRSETGERLPIEGPDGTLPDGVLPLRGLTLTVVE